MGQLQVTLKNRREEGTPITGTLQASDPDGLSDNTYFSIEEGDQASNGIATIDSSNGEWTFSPNEGFYGEDNFSVTVTDDLGGITKQIISISVSEESIKLTAITEDTTTPDGETVDKSLRAIATRRQR